MDQVEATQLGLGALVALLILEKVFAFLGSRNGWRQQIRDLHTWHSKTDDDGVPVWYVRRSLETAIKELTKAISSLTVVVRDMKGGQEKMAEEVHDVKSNVDVMKGDTQSIKRRLDQLEVE